MSRKATRPVGDAEWCPTHGEWEDGSASCKIAYDPDDYTGESGRKVDVQRVLKAIHRHMDDAGINTESYTYEADGYSWDNADHRESVRRQFEQNGPVKEAILPNFGPEGHAENARDDCGEPHPFVCDSCGKHEDFGRTCGMSVCGRCGVAWVRNTAISKSAKVRRVRKEKHHHTPDNEHQKLHHQIISPSLGWYSALARAGYTLQEAQDVTQDVVKDILSEMRAPSLLIRHSYRGENEDGSIAAEADDRGEWKQRLNSGREWYGDVRDELAWKPHYHCIAVGDWLEGGALVDEVQERTGWVIHRITDDEGYSFEKDGQMARGTCYSLSHADIQVRDDAPNRSAVWEVGSFEGDAIAASSRFSASPSDKEWADAVIRRCANDILGLACNTTDCGASIPPVDDPDELARQILEELYPDDADRRERADTDAVLFHVQERHISVDVSSHSGGGGNVTVRDAFGEPAAAWGGNLPSPPKTGTFDGSDDPLPIAVDPVQDECDDDSCTDHDHDRDDRPDECDGQLVPLDEARRRGLLDDAEWCKQAAHVDEAREADRAAGEDLEPWRATSPGTVVGAG